MFTIIIISAIYCFALLIIHTKRLITVALSLASVSALTATLLYMNGATTVAVIELSVGAGLVAVLFTFANAILAERQDQFGKAMPRLLALIVVLSSFALLIVSLINEFLYPTTMQNTHEFTVVFWQDRGADMVALMSIMFTTIIGVAALLNEQYTPLRERAIMEDSV